IASQRDHPAIPPHLSLPSLHPIALRLLVEDAAYGTGLNQTGRQRRNRLRRDTEMKNEKTHNELPTNAPPIVSPQEWEAARQRLLDKEKAVTHARDALAAERRRMPWMAVEK